MIRKLRFIEPGNYSLYKKSWLNGLVYNKHIKNPSTGLITLATIAKRIVDDTLMYSESISSIRFEDIYDADIVFFGINTFNAVRGYELAREIRGKSKAILVFGGMHASLNWQEAIQYCDYVLTGDADESIVEFIEAVRDGGKIDFPGVVKRVDGAVAYTGAREQPENIETIPDRNLVHGYSKLAKKYDTLWPQVHASRGCPHTCAYCAVIAHFGRKFRKRSPENVVADIREAVAFHRRAFPPRLNSIVWITDDNFAHDREWAISVLKAIISSGIKARYSVQARFEIGFDDELLDLMKEAGFLEVALGIEFVHDDSFRKYKKSSSNADIVRSIRNIRKHGLGVRGLFIVGAESDTKGIGADIVRFVRENKIHGALIQSMFFTPGTPVYESSKDLLIHRNWEKYDGNVVHYPANIRPDDLQREIISASAGIYSFGALLRAVFSYRWINKILFIGEYLWQMSLRADLKKELPYLQKVSDARIA